MTTDPFDPDYLDELALRGDLTAFFTAVIDGPRPVADHAVPADLRPWSSVVAAAVADTPDGHPTSLTPTAQDRIIDAWAEELLDRARVGDAARDASSAVVPVVRRALQVRVRNDGLTPRLWIDRTFAGRRASYARALVRSFGTPAGRGTCRCLDEPIVAGWECCGSPWLANGDLERFIRRARRNVALLAEVVQAGRPNPIPDPVCRSIVTQDYLTYIGGPAATAVADAYLAADSAT